MFEQLAQHRVRKAAARGDGVELFPDSCHTMSLNEDAAVEFVAHDDGWNKRESGAFIGEQPEHGHVVDFGQDDRADVCQVQQAIEANADVAVEAG